MPDFRIRVIIDPSGSQRGSRAVRGELTSIERQADRVGSAITRAFAFAGITVGIGGLVRLADEYTNLQNRIRVVTDGQDELAAVTDRLFEIANKTRSSFASTTEVYARTALAAKDLGISQQEVLDFTESPNQAITIGGSTAAEANNAMIQLSQGLASGALRGDELRSVLEQLPVVADVIADELGVTRGELRKMGEDGAITADIVLNAFKNAREELEERFGETVPTIGQSFEVLKNNLMGLAGEFFTNSGAAEALARSILFVGENLDNIIPLIVAAGAAFAAWRATAAISAVLGPMIALERALGATSAAGAIYSLVMKGAQRQTMLFTAAIAANPIGAIAVALTTVITLLYVFSDEIKVSEDGLVTLGDVAAVTWDIIVEGISFVTDFLRSAWETAVGAVNALLSVFGTTFSAVISGIVDFAKAAINAYIGLWVFAYRAVSLAWNNAPGFFDAIFTAIVNLGASAAETLLNAWQTPLRLIAGGLSLLDDEAGAALSGFLDNFNVSIPRRVASEAGQQFAQDLQEAAASSFSEDYIGNALGEIMARAQARALARQNGGGDVDLTGSGEAAALAGGADDAAARRARGTKAQTDELERQLQVLTDWFAETEQEIALLGMSNRERERAQEIYRLENDLKRELTTTERELVDARLDELQAARDAATIRDVLEDLDRENDLLTTNVEEREARAEILRVEARLGRELNEIEAEEIRQRVEQNRAISEANDLYDALNDRRREAIRQLEAIQRLRSSITVGDVTGQPAISELDARIAREDIGLVQDLRGLDQDLGGEFANQAELDNIRALEDERLKIVEDALETRLITEQEAADRRVAIEAETQRQIRDLEVARQSFALQSAQSTFESLAEITKTFAGEQSSIYKAMFIASKAFAIADSVIKIQQGIANALSLPFPANLGAVAAVAAQAASIVSNIQAISLNLADGGLVRGPGGPRSDSIPANLSNGEYVVNARATSQYRGLLDQINSGREPSLLPQPANNNGPSRGRVSVQQHPGVDIEVHENLTTGDVEVIARRVAKQEARTEGPRAAAGAIRDPNSKLSKSLSQTTTARRKRA